MTREVLLEIWMEGARLATIAKLLGEDPYGVEDAVRMELRRIQEEFRTQPEETQPPAVGAVTEGDPGPRQAQNGAAPSSGRPARRRKAEKNIENLAAAMKQNPVRRRVESAVSAETYPPCLSGTQNALRRMVFNALRSEPKDLSGLCDECELSSETAHAALTWLHQRGLVHKPELYLENWSLTPEALS